MESVYCSFHFSRKSTWSIRSVITIERLLTSYLLMSLVNVSFSKGAALIERIQQKFLGKLRNISAKKTNIFVEISANSALNNLNR